MNKALKALEAIASRRLTVTFDKIDLTAGAVVPCDYFTGLELSLGNVFAGGGFRKVWFGEDFRRLRARFAQRKLAGVRCESCALNYAGVDRCISHVFRFAKA